MEFENKCVVDLEVLEGEIAACKKRINELNELLQELLPIK